MSETVRRRMAQPKRRRSVITNTRQTGWLEMTDRLGESQAARRLES